MEEEQASFELEDDIQQSPFAYTGAKDSDKVKGTPEIGDQRTPNGQYLDNGTNLSTIQEEQVKSAGSNQSIHRVSADVKFGKHMKVDSNNSSIMNIQRGSQGLSNKSSSGPNAVFRDSSLSRESPTQNNSSMALTKPNKGLSFGEGTE